MMATVTQIVEAIGRSASWDNPALTTWEDLNHSLDLELMRRRSQWSNLGKSDDELVKEIMAERQRGQR